MKMHVKRHIVLLVCLLACTVGFAQEAKTPHLRINDTGNGVLKVDFQLQGVGLELVGWNFSRMTSNGMSFGTGRENAPDLPTASMLLRLPTGSTLKVSDIAEKKITETLWPELREYPLAPVVRGWAKDQSWPGYEPDTKIYETDGYYRSGDLMEVEHLGRMGREEIYRLTVRPVAYNPVSGGVKIWERIEGTLLVSKGYPAVPKSEEVLLIVSRPEFEVGLQDFVRWKRQEGYHVEELYVETPKRDSIKEMMQPYFLSENPLHAAPDYILLVGDAAQIQSFIGETSLDGEGHTTDLYYADFTGDYLPEALLGRWPVNDTAELRIVVEKTLRYEQFNSIDTTQLKRLLLVAGNEQYSPAPLTTNAQVNYVGRETKTAHPEIDTLTFHNPQSGSQVDTIVSSIGYGASLLNYTAHCTVGGWTSPALTIGRVEEASATQPMVYVNNCCKSNTFSGTGFGEQLLRLPVGGGVGVIGATNSTLWYEDYYWAVGPKWPVTLNVAYDSAARGAFDALTGSHPSIATLGELLAAGNLAVTAFGTGYAKFYWEIYCLLGDPTLRPWIGVPQHIELFIADSIFNGSSEINVDGTPGARVTAMQDGQLLGVADIDSLGQASLRLSQTLDTLPLILTATGQGLQPRIDTLRVNTDIRYGVALREVAVSDTTVNCIVENIGHCSIDTLKIVLTQTGEDTLNGALLREQIAIIDSLPAGAHQSVVIPVAVEAIGSQPYWQATLMAWEAGSGTLCDLTLRHALEVHYPTLTLRLTDASGREARRVLPEHSYRLEATVDGVADSLRLSAETLPFGQWSDTANILDFSTLDSICALGIGATLHLDGWRNEQRYWLEPGERIDSFEQGFDSHPWQNNGRVAWTLDSMESHSGHFSVRSGAIEDGQLTQLCLEVIMPMRDSVSYWVKTSTEERHDKMTFLVDGRAFTPEAWGIGDWRQRTHVIAAGRHTLCWRYAKDGSGRQGDDCVWLDDIQIPLALWDSVYAWDCAGPSPLRITQTDRAILIKLYPNPTNEGVWIEGRPGTTVSIGDVMGRTIASFSLTSEGAHHWDASALQAGIYYATGTLDGQRSTQKIILIKP